MPSSGARSGTKANPRAKAPVGRGNVGPVRLACGHETHGQPTISTPTAKWFCSEGCGLVAAK